MGRPREVAGMLEKVKCLASSQHHCHALKEKKEGRTSKRNKISGQRKRRANKRQIETRKERK